MSLAKKFLNIVKEHTLASVFVAFMACVYIYMMFTNGPWYDELYTYYYFISRGPVYAAIHWPVPNNHVGYSVTSAFLDFFGNPYIGLRGVSVIAAVANLILLYRFGLRFLDKKMSFTISALYGAAYLIHRLAIQGRGYSLATTCFLVAVISCCRICTGEHRRSDYWLFAGAMCYGLYIVPSSLYFVLPICVTGGIYLLLTKEYKTLLKLFLSGVASACATFFLYSLIWLAIGANLVSKDAGSQYFGLNQAKVVLKAPFLSMKTGIEYMTATPYIQSIDRLSCIKGLPLYFKELFDNFYDRMGICVLIITLICLVFCLISLIRRHKDQGSKLFANLFAVVYLIMVPLMLILQSVHPYKRVLGFMLVPMVIAFVLMISSLIELLKKDEIRKVIKTVVCAAALFYATISVLSSYYRAPLADRENELEALFSKADTDKIDIIYYTDDYQKYVLKFYHDVTPVEVYTLEEANYVIIGPEQRDETYDAPQWPVLYPYSDGLLQDVSEKMVEIATAGNYTIYAKH